MTRLEGQANPIRCFDATLVDCLKQLIDKMRAQLNLLIILRADLEALAERTTAALKAKRIFEPEDLE